MDLKVRLATIYDADDVITMLEEFNKTSGYTHQFDEPFARDTFFAHIQSPDFLVLLLVGPNDVPVGILSAYVANHPYWNIKFASQLLWYVYPEYRGYKKNLKLLEGFEYWAIKKMDAKFISISFRTNPKMSKVLGKMGYVEREHMWTKEF